MRSGWIKGEGVLTGPLVFSAIAALVFLLCTSKVYAGYLSKCEAMALSATGKRMVQDVARIRVQPLIEEAGELQAGGMPDLCTGFAVRVRGSGTKLVTAGHCLPQVISQSYRDQGQEFDQFAFVVDDGFVATPEVERSVQEGNVKEMQASKIHAIEGHDLGFVEIGDRALDSTRALELSPLPPRFGERLFAVGYPGGFGPVRLQCRYVGVGLRTADHWESMVAIDELDCPEAAEFEDGLGGISGGAVVNAQNQVVGVIVQQIQSSIGNLNPGAMARVGMVPLTKRNLTAAQSFYRPTRWSGSYSSRYLDWTSGKEVRVRFGLKKGRLEGPTRIEDEKGQVIEEWHFTGGNWTL